MQKATSINRNIDSVQQLSFFMLYEFSTTRLNEYQQLYLKHYGKDISLEEASENLASLLGMLSAVRQGGKTGKDPPDVTGE